MLSMSPGSLEASIPLTSSIQLPQIPSLLLLLSLWAQHLHTEEKKHQTLWGCKEGGENTSDCYVEQMRSMKNLLKIQLLTTVSSELSPFPQRGPANSLPPFVLEGKHQKGRTLQREVIPLFTVNISFLFVGVTGDKTVPKEPG